LVAFHPGRADDPFQESEVRNYRLLTASIAFTISMASAWAKQLLWITLAASTLAIVLSTSPASAQIIQLQCQSSNGLGGYLATVDYGRKTLTVDNMDSAGDIQNIGFQNMPAAITSDSIIADSQQRCGLIRWLLNRRSGILLSSHTDACGGTAVTKPYKAAPPRF
jgi:hypothetical protein